MNPDLVKFFIMSDEEIQTEAAKYKKYEVGYAALITELARRLRDQLTENSRQKAHLAEVARKSDYTAARLDEIEQLLKQLR